MDLLGANLDQLLQKESGKFSLKTVIQLADQMICRIKFVHDNGYLHRDIKPGSVVQTDETTPNNVGTCSASWEGYNPQVFVNHA